MGCVMRVLDYFASGWKAWMRYSIGCVLGKRSGLPRFGDVPSARSLAPGVLVMLGLVWITGCRTVEPMRAVDLREPGWVVRQGQAIWKSSEEAPEIAGELVLASKPDGSSFVQFTKTPLPLVTAQTTKSAWQIQFVPENRSFRGRGKPPRRLLWLQVPRCLQGDCDERSFEFRSLPNGNQVLRDRKSGESIEFFLTPVSASWRQRESEIGWAWFREVDAASESKRRS